MNVDEFDKLGDEDAIKPVLQNFSLIPGFLSLQQCKYLINYIESQTNQQVRLPTRNRLIIDSPNLANWLWEKKREWIRQSVYHTCIDKYGDEWECIGVNERFRLVKYNKNDRFDLHEDGYFQRSYDEKSFATFMVYLNDVDVENGGETHFVDFSFKIQPKQGLCVIFFVEGLMHRGEVLKEGEKYILRTDLMYKLVKSKDESIRKKMYDLENQEIETVSGWKQYFDLEEKLINIK